MLHKCFISCSTTNERKKRKKKKKKDAGKTSTNETLHPLKQGRKDGRCALRNTSGEEGKINVLCYERRRMVVVVEAYVRATH